MALTEFLLARIAEDEAVARDVVAGGGYDGRDSTGPRPDEEYGGLHIGAARVLAECEAKRRIVERYAPTGRYPDIRPVHLPVVTGVLRLLALPYADHPDYRQEWKP